MKASYNLTCFYPVKHLEKIIQVEYFVILS